MLVKILKLKIILYYIYIKKYKNIFKTNFVNFLKYKIILKIIILKNYIILKIKKARGKIMRPRKY